MEGIMSEVLERPAPAVSTPDLTTEKAAAAALKTFFSIMEKWGCTDSATQMALLGLRAPRTFHNWKKLKSGPLPKDTTERLSYIFGIYKALHLLLPDKAIADQWVRQPNTAPLFGGHSALDRMKAGNVADLHAVRQYLDAERGWG